MMNLSENTIAVLKNFSDINEGIVLRPGNVQRVLKPGGQIFAEAVIEEEIPVKIGIHNTRSFISNIMAIGGQNAEIDFFEDKMIKISTQGMSLGYEGCEPSLLVYPKGSVPFENSDVTFKLTHEIIEKMKRIAALNKLTYIQFSAKNGVLQVRVYDPEGVTHNYGTFEIGETDVDDFEVSYAVDYFRFLPMDYQVDVKIGQMARFISEDGKITYFISQQAEEI